MDPASSSPRLEKNQSLLSSIFWLGLVGGTASFIRTSMLNQAQDSIASRLRKEAFRSLMADREMEWFLVEDRQKKKKEFEDKSIRRKAEKYVWAEAIREAPRLMIGALAMAVSSYSNQGW